METIFSSFNITSASTFNELLKKTNSIVAGSAPLAALVGGFVPNDLDIWVYPGPCTKTDNQYSDEAYAKLVVTRNDFNEYLSSIGYKRNLKIAGEYHTVEADGYDDPTTPVGKVIRKIDRFYLESDTKCTGKSIQVIFTRVPVMEAVYAFDLSICRTWWDGEKLFTWDPESTLIKLMYPLRPTASPREIERIKKYEERGFINKKTLKCDSYTHRIYHRHICIKTFGEEYAYSSDTYSSY